MPIKHRDATGLTLYVRFDDADDTAVDLVEGSGLKQGLYELADSAISTAGLDAGTYLATVFSNATGAAGQDATDTPRASRTFRWSGAAEITSTDGAANVLQEDIAQGFVFRLGTRANAIATADNTITLASRSERPRFAFDMRPITRSKPTTIQSVEVLGSDGAIDTGLTVATEGDTTNCGVRDYLVMSKVTGCTTADTFTIRITVATGDSAVFVLQGDIVAP